MKKRILALAVAAALATPLAVQADTTLYGSARVSLDYVDDDSNTDSFWDVTNNDSRFGVLGSEDLGGGLSAVYQYEFGVDLTEGTSGFESNRPKFVGLKGSFGTISAGTQESPYYHVTGITDIFNSGRTFLGDVWLGGSFSFGKRGEGALTRLDNSIFYATPDFNGFSGEAMLVMDGRVNSVDGFANGVDIWNIALKYSNGPWFAGLSYIKLGGESNVFVNSTTTADLDLDQWTLGLGYASGPFSIGFAYEQGTFNSYGLVTEARVNGVRVGGDDSANYYLVGSYSFGNSIISAGYGYLDPGTQGSKEINNYILGYQYNLSKRTRLWAEYIGRSSDNLDDLNSPFPIGDLSAFSFGTRVDF